MTSALIPGKMLGTSMLAALLEVFFSIVPQGVVSKVFPPVVSAVAVTLIGVALTGTGMKYWGGKKTPACRRVSISHVNIPLLNYM